MQHKEKQKNNVNNKIILLILLCKNIQVFMFTYLIFNLTLFVSIVQSRILSRIYALNSLQKNNNNLISQSMDQNLHCIGCRTSFEDQEELLPTHTIEFKGYSIPFKEQSVKWSILKAIVSFLNTKGGTILIGVSPRSNKVDGLFLERKERDNFKLTLKQLIEKIFPKVDLNNRQEVEVQYVPVFSGPNFQGKFVVKIIVQQGDPTQLYCMSEKIKLVEDGSNKSDEMEVYYSYERQNSGIVEFKGFDLLNEIFAKAVTATQGSVFHDDCNPEPPYLQIDVRTIRFSHLNPIQYETLLLNYGAFFEEKKIDYDIGYNQNTQIAQIVIEDAEDFQMVKDYIQEHFEFLDQMFKQSQYPTHFVIKGQIQHYFQISNQYNTKEKKDKKHYKKVESPKQSAPKFPYQQRKVKREQVSIKKQEKAARNLPEVKLDQKALKIDEKNAITFTHIQPKAINSLQQYLNQHIYRAYEKKFQKFTNTLVLQLINQKQFNNYLQELVRRQKQISSYGFKGQIRYGICSNKLKICNADWNMSKQLKIELKNMMGAVLLDTKSEKNALVLDMINREQACLWLDQLLMNKNFKRKYAIHSRNKHENTPKMKIYLDMEDIAVHK